MTCIVESKNWIPNLELSIDEINETHEVGEEHCLNVVLKESPCQEEREKRGNFLYYFTIIFPH